MKHSSFLRFIAWLLLAGLLALVGCSSDDDDNNNNDRFDVGNQSDVERVEDAMTTEDTATVEDVETTEDSETVEDVESNEDVSDEEDVLDEEEEPIEPTPIPSELGPVESCDEITEIDSVDCFSNADCEDLDQRCENVGGTEFYVSCCVPGVRGIRPAGASCAEDDGDLRCASGLCIDRNEAGKVCAEFCEDDDSCPAAAPNCVEVPFLGSVCVTD